MLEFSDEVEFFLFLLAEPGPEAPCLDRLRCSGLMLEPDLFLLSLGFSLILLGSMNKINYYNFWQSLEKISLTTFFHWFRWNAANGTLSFALPVCGPSWLELITLDGWVFTSISRGLGRTRAARWTWSFLLILKGLFCLPLLIISLSTFLVDFFFISCLFCRSSSFWSCNLRRSSSASFNSVHVSFPFPFLPLPLSLRFNCSLLSCSLSPPLLRLDGLIRVWKLAFLCKK